MPCVGGLEDSGEDNRAVIPIFILLPSTKISHPQKSRSWNSYKWTSHSSSQAHGLPKCDHGTREALRKAGRLKLPDPQAGALLLALQFPGCFRLALSLISKKGSFVPGTDTATCRQTVPMVSHGTRVTIPTQFLQHNNQLQQDQLESRSLEMRCQQAIFPSKVFSLYLQLQVALYVPGFVTT